VWHWSYCLGDAIPDGVTDAPGGAPTAAPPDWAAIAATDQVLSAVAFAGELRLGAPAPPPPTGG
jgi:hypothetical protein